MPKKKDEDKERRSSKAEVPDELQQELPKQAQDIYRDALNRALDEYKSWGREELQTTAHRIALAAVREEYEKGEDGKWRRKGGKGGDEDI